MSKKRARKEGRCRFTGRIGPYVESHIVPKALTRPSVNGSAFVQAGGTARPTRKFDSWYDDELLTNEGEAAFDRIDNDGINLVRSHQLVWSGWNEGDDVLRANLEEDPESGIGIRIVEGVDRRVLRLFLLGILWRAAESNREPFQAIVLPDGHAEIIKQMIRARDPWESPLYPAILMQIVERGDRHNYAPFAVEHEVEVDGEGVSVPTFRFYFDGLIVHFLRGTTDAAPWGRRGIQDDIGKLPVLTVRAIKSAHIRSLQLAIAEAEVHWPETLKSSAIMIERNIDLSQLLQELAVASETHMALLQVLEGDAIEALERLESDRESQFLRRAFARNMLAFVHQLATFIRNQVVVTNRLGLLDDSLPEREVEKMSCIDKIGLALSDLDLEAAVKTVFSIAARVWRVNFSAAEAMRELVVARYGRNRAHRNGGSATFRITDEEMHYYILAASFIKSRAGELLAGRKKQILSRMPPELREKIAHQLE